MHDRPECRIEALQDFENRWKAVLYFGRVRIVLGEVGISGLE